MGKKKVDIAIIRVIVFPLKEPRNLSHSYVAVKLSSETREMLHDKNTHLHFSGKMMFPLYQTLKCIFL